MDYTGLYIATGIIFYAAFVFATFYWIAKNSDRVREKLNTVKSLAESATTLEDCQKAWKLLKEVNSQIWHRYDTALVREIAAVLKTKTGFFKEATGPRVMTRDEAVSNYKDYLTVGKLRETLSRLPDDAVVLVERVEDFYYQKHGWAVVTEDDPIEPSFQHQYHPGWEAWSYEADPRILWIGLHN